MTKAVCINPHNIPNRPGADLGLQHSGGYTTTDVFTGENLGSVLPDHQMDLMVNPNGMLPTQNLRHHFFCTIVRGGPIIWAGNKQGYILSRFGLMTSRRAFNPLQCEGNGGKVDDRISYWDQSNSRQQYNWSWASSGCRALRENRLVGVRRRILIDFDGNTMYWNQIYGAEHIKRRQRLSYSRHNTCMTICIDNY